MQKGFSLVELLVVMAIVMIVIGLGLSQFSAYKKQANDITAATDIKTIVGDMYKYHEENGSYNEDSLPAPRLSEGVNYTIELTGSAREDFKVYTWHAKGTKTWCYSYNGPGKEFGRKGLSSTKELAKACSDGHSLTSR